jgi:hypothetical protein
MRAFIVKGRTVRAPVDDAAILGILVRYARRQKVVVEVRVFRVVGFYAGGEVVDTDLKGLLV